MDLRQPCEIELRAALAALDIPQHRLAAIFSVEPRSVRRWRSGDRPIPAGVGLVAGLLFAGKVTLAEVEQIAFASARTPDFDPAVTDIKSEEPVLPESAAGGCAEPVVASPEFPEPSGPDPVGVDFAELGPGQCKWPFWGNERPSIYEARFCGAVPVAGSPYCVEHSLLAFKEHLEVPRSSQPRRKRSHFALLGPRFTQL
jgi:hypothetical protein